MRCFVGLDLASEIQPIATRAREHLLMTTPALEGEKWVAPENIHVTLAFLGDVDEKSLREIVGILAETVSEMPSPALVCTGLRAMPTSDRATMVWLEFEDPGGRFGSLAHAVREAVAPYSEENDPRVPRAHATLVRMRRAYRSILLPDVGELLGDLPSTIVSDPSVTLFSSRLTPRGPVYGRLASWTLRGQAK